MAPSLPPKTSRPTPENLQKLDDALTSVTAGHPGAVNLWTFYEVVDGYLGPWGNSGYPIAYGKRYCERFTTNTRLSANPTAKAWVWKTTILLQEELKEFILSRFRQGTMATLTEAEFRQYAFSSHPRAYTKGGLTLVVVVAPELLPDIASIPKAEFSPVSPNFAASLRQVVDTGGMVGPRVVGVTLAAFAGPAHNGMFAMAARRDSQRMTQELRLGEYLSNVKHMIQQGSLDDLLVLERLTDKLNRTEFPDEGFARLAREVIAAANSRKCAVLIRYPTRPLSTASAQAVARVTAMCAKP